MENMKKYTVASLISVLRQFDPKQEVWVARDEEGNTHHRLAWVCLSKITDTKTVVVIYPINSDEDIY
jgi:hypothetical protein